MVFASAGFPGAERLRGIEGLGGGSSQPALRCAGQCLGLFFWVT